MQLPAQTFEVAEQRGARRGLVRVAAGEHDAVARAVLQRDAPLPAPVVRHRTGQRHGRAGGFRLHGDGAVVEQPLRPVLVFHAHRLAQQQRAEARAVDEQVALDARARIQHERGDVARGRVCVDARDLRFDALRAEVFGKAPQVAGVARGVQVVGVVDALVRQVAEAFFLRRHELQAVIAVVAREAAVAALEPEVLEAGRPVVGAGHAERVDVVFPARAPAFEADAQLERGLCRGHEFLLADVEQAVEVHEARDRRLAHAHGSDVVRFDELDVDDLAKGARQRRRGHPAGRAAAGDDDAADRAAAVRLVFVVHVSTPGLYCLSFYLLIRRSSWPRRMRAPSSSSGDSA